MRKLSLLIVDRDEDYLKNLASYLSTNHFNEFKITSISSDEYLNRYLEQVQGIDILLINYSFYDKNIENKFINTIIIIGEEDLSNSKKYDKYIWKFQAASQIYNKIKHYFISVNPNFSEQLDNKGKNTKVACIYSPIGGCGKTVTAITILLKLCESSKEVLYLNFEDISSTPLFLPCNNKRSISDLLYLAKDRDINLKTRIVEYLNRDNNGISYFAPANSILDFETIKKEDIIYLINTIKALNKFDYVIIDLSSKFGSIYSGIICNSDNVLAILGTDLQGKLKMDTFLMQQESLDKFTFIINKYKNENQMKMIPEELKKVKKPIFSRIDYYDVMDGNINGLEYLKENNPFTLGINQIVQKLFNV